MRTVAYGSRPLPLPDGLVAEIRLPPAPPPESDTEELLSAALEAPIGSPPLAELVQSAQSLGVVVVVSDATRDEPRGLLFHAIRRELAALPAEQIVIAVANGTHSAGPPAALGLGPETLKRHRIVNHDSTDLASLVEVGTTSRGTRVRINRVVTEAGLVVMTGRIKPHYFAGYGGGAKAAFPGLAGREEILKNHLLKEHPASRLGIVEGNLCRADMEEAVGLLPGRAFVLNVVMAADRVVSAVAGDVIAAHRAGCAMARPYCEVTAAPADIVIVSDALPVTMNLYQAAKLLAPAAALVREGGVVILAAECPRGTGPLDLVNEAIYRRGVRHHFAGASEPEIILVSSLPSSVVEQTFCHYAASLDEAMKRAVATVGEKARVLVLPRAGDLIPRLA